MTPGENGFPTLLSLWPNQCISVKDGLRCMLHTNHPTIMHYNDVSETVSWEDREGCTCGAYRADSHSPDCRVRRAL